MANEQVVSFLNDFSIEVTPNAAKKIDNFSDYLSPGTLIYIAHIEGTPIEETVATAKKITDQGFKAMPHFPARSIKNQNEHKALALMKKASVILSFLLLISTLIGILFNELIVELLFQRGEFTHEDTLNTAIILLMYLLGLLPYGISKIFSLWLYAKEKQFIAAKISMKALTFNIVFSLILFKPYGAAGLAFASTIAGFVLFYFTIKEFGFMKFYNLFKKQ